MHLNLSMGLLAQAGGQGTSATPTQSLFGSPIVLLVLMGVMMYFVVFRPQQQRAKQQAKMLSALKSGDKVATSAGIIGTVITVKDKSVTLRSADSKFEVTKASVTDILEAGTTTES